MSDQSTEVEVTEPEGGFGDRDPVFIRNPADGSVGTCNGYQWRNLYKAKGYALAPESEYRAWEARMEAERAGLPVEEGLVTSPETIAEQMARNTETVTDLAPAAGTPTGDPSVLDPADFTDHQADPSGLPLGEPLAVDHEEG